MRKALSLLFLGLIALAQEVTVYPGFAEIKEPLRLPPSAWVYLGGERLEKTVPGSLRLLGVVEEERFYRPGAVFFRYRGEGEAVLRYLYLGLRGEVFYTLEEGRLTAWARLTLEGEPLEAKRLTLLTGEAPVLERAVAYKALAESPGENPFGLFRYQLPPRRLETGTTEFPFLRADLKPTRLLRYQGPFRTAGVLPLERGYRFQAPFPLAQGSLEAVEEGLFLGRALLPPTPEGEVAEVFLGRDAGARLLRRVEEVAQGEKERAYRVETVLENPYPYPVTLLLSEVFPQPFRLDFPGATLLPEGYRLEVPLRAKEARRLVYRVVLAR